MVARGSITVNAAIIAEVSLDPAAVRGAGPPLGPRLVVPFNVAMAARPAESALGIHLLSTELWLGQAGGSGLRIGQPVVLIGIGGPPPTLVSSTGSKTDNATVEFALAPDHVHALEEHAVRAAPEPVPFTLRLIASCVAVEQHDVPHPVGDGRSFMLGGYRLTHLPQSRADDVKFTVPREQWAEIVLPALGLHRVRLVPVVFPEVGVGPSDAGERFDQARRHLDAGRWTEAIRACRDVRYAVEQGMGATNGIRVHKALAEKRGVDAVSLAFLDQAWIGLAELTNAASHPQGAMFGASEARLAVLLTAVLLDFVHRA